MCECVNLTGNMSTVSIGLVAEGATWGDSGRGGVSQSPVTSQRQKSLNNPSTQLNNLKETTFNTSGNVDDIPPPQKNPEKNRWKMLIRNSGNGGDVITQPNAPEPHRNRTRTARVTPCCPCLNKPTSRTRHTALDQHSNRTRTARLPVEDTRTAPEPLG